MTWLVYVIQVPPNVTTTFKVFTAAPSLLWWVDAASIDFALDMMAWAGIVLSLLLVVLGTGNAILFAVLWVLYHSIVNVGQRW